jgi:hypothetical protein
MTYNCYSVIVDMGILVELILQLSVLSLRSYTTWMEVGFVNLFSESHGYVWRRF